MTALEKLARSIASFRPNAYFSDVAQCISSAKMRSFSGRKYWTMHLARMFANGVCPRTHVSGMRFGEACAKHLVEMGRGAQEASSLGVRPPYLRTLQGLARTMSVVAGAYGFDKAMFLPTVVCTVCESHRRGVLARGKFHRRPGL